MSIYRVWTDGILVKVGFEENVLFCVGRRARSFERTVPDLVISLVPLLLLRAGPSFDGNLIFVSRTGRVSFCFSE